MKTYNRHQLQEIKFDDDYTREAAGQDSVFIQQYPDFATYARFMNARYSGDIEEQAVIIRTMLKNSDGTPLTTDNGRPITDPDLSIDPVVMLKIITGVADYFLAFGTRNLTPASQVPNTN